MSDATRAFALTEASKLNLPTYEEVLVAAAAYDAFMNASDDIVPAGTKPVAKAVAAKPAAAAAKPVGKKAGKSEEEVVKAALEAQRAEAEAADGEGGEEGADEPSDELPASKDGCQAAIARLLKANKRKEAISLLKKYGAASVSGIKSKDFAKFVAEASALVGESEDDLTA